MDLKPPDIPEKDFFTMGEVCRLVQVPAHTLRYWEERVGLLRPARRSSGHRRYTRADIETAWAIKDLVGRRRMTVAGARKALLARKRGEPQAAAAPGAPPPAPASALKALREIKKELRALVAELGR